MRTTIKMLFLGSVLVFVGLKTTAQTDLAAVATEKKNDTRPADAYLQKREAFPAKDDVVKNEEDAIREVLLDYIEGTANGEPERIQRAFHSDLNLYSIADNTLKVLPGQEYISYFKSGEKRERIGKIMAVDYENDAATAKVEILMPSRKRVYTDYFLLLKIDNTWKIIHKSFTFQPMED